MQPGVKDPHYITLNIVMIIMAVKQEAEKCIGFLPYFDLLVTIRVHLSIFLSFVIQLKVVIHYQKISTLMILSLAFL